jgi:hypothetical protein
MPQYGPSGLDNVNVVGNYLRGRASADDERAANTSNALNQQTLQQRQVVAGDEQKQANAKQLLIASQYALQVPPGQTKAFVESNFPDLVAHAGPQWAAYTDEQVRSELQGVQAQSGAQAGVGPAPAPIKYTTKSGPRGSVIQENPQTGEQKQVVGPDNSQPAPVSNQGARPPSGYRYAADGSLEPIPGGPADLGARPKNLRAVPPAIASGVISNRQELAKIDRAIAALQANPDAVGMQNYLPDAITQRAAGAGMSGGVDARAKLADISSMVIHDRSGAAVSASEFPRLSPFIPQKTDSSQTVLTKLQNMKANLQAMNEETEGAFTEDSGYRPIGGGDPQQATAPASGIQPASAPVKVRSIQEARKLAPGTVFLTPDGRRKVR